MKFVIAKKKELLKTFGICVALVMSVVLVGLSGSYVIYAGQTTRKLPIYCVQTDEKVVALSFDASWGADKTLGILETLEKFDIKANYFVVGFWATKYSEELKKLSDSGRVEIGTHSNTHPHMNKKSKSEMKLELETSIKTIEEITSKKIELFRAPFGEYCDDLISVAEEMGLYTIQWDVDSLDWKNLSSGEIANRILNKVKNGSIVLMHNDGAHTLEALPAIISGLKNKGYSFKTIGELIYRDNYTIDHTGMQIKE